MAHIGHNVVADPIYKLQHNKYLPKLNEEIKQDILNVKGQMLHAYKLGFIHPTTKEYMEFNADEPIEMLNIYNKLNLI
jgi:23S rRNA pseudouridine1911/1915/1917 synthase